jgi:hypothetical protein
MDLGDDCQVGLSAAWVNKGHMKQQQATSIVDEAVTEHRERGVRCFRRVVVRSWRRARLGVNQLSVAGVPLNLTRLGRLF